MSPSAPRSVIPNMSVDQMIRWRKEHRYTREALASRLGLDKRTIQYWEDPARRPPWYAAALLHWIECQEPRKPRSA